MIQPPQAAGQTLVFPPLSNQRCDPAYSLHSARGRQHTTQWRERKFEAAHLRIGYRRFGAAVLGAPRVPWRVGALREPGGCP